MLDLTAPRSPALRSWHPFRRNLLALLALLLAPTVAMAEVGEGAVKKVLDILTGPLAITAATLVVVFLGYRAWAGEITWRPVVHFVLGCVFIFGAAEFASMFTSGV